MSDSSFINKETLGYLQAQVGATTPQRVANVEQSIQEIDGYLREQQQFLTDYEGYLDSKVTDLESAVTQHQSQIGDLSIQITKARLDAKIQIEALESYIRTTMVLTLGTLFLTLAGGLVLWLVK